MPKLDGIFICEYALIDKSNKLSMIGEFTSIYFKEFPAPFPVVYIITRWNGQEGETFTEKVRFVDSAGNQTVEIVNPLIEIKSQKTTNIYKFELVPFEAPGEYHVEAYANDDLAGKERFFARSQGG